MGPLRFEIDPVVGEGQRGCAAVVRALMPRSRLPLFMLVIYAAIGLAAWGLPPGARALSFLIGVGAVFATAAAIHLEQQARLRRLQAQDPHASERYYVELDEHGVRTWCAHIDARHPWSDFARVAEDSEFYLFARSSGAGIALPKRVVSDALEPELRQRLRDWAPDRGTGLARELIS